MPNMYASDAAKEMLDELAKRAGQILGQEVGAGAVAGSLAEIFGEEYLDRLHRAEAVKRGDADPRSNNNNRERKR